MVKNNVEAKVWLEKHYSDSAPGKSTIEKWFAKFIRVIMSIKIRCTQWTPETGRRKHKKVHKIILNDRRMKLIEIAETLKIY
jgi:hypothetical protein